MCVSYQILRDCVREGGGGGEGHINLCVFVSLCVCKGHTEKKGGYGSKALLRLCFVFAFILFLIVSGDESIYSLKI